MNNVANQALAILKRFYGYDSFLPLQLEVIEHVVAGNDCVVLMPTGGGKSLCYQLPALMCEGCAIVVSPLLALMTDQVDALLANGIPAAAINSEHSDSENREIIENVYRGNIKLLYISPEKLVSELEQWSRDMKISLIAIDEAHCISQWGHDFRPEYTQLKVLKQNFPEVPVMALTATADRLTRDDIGRQLGIEGAKTFITSFDRPNIRLDVRSNVAGQDKFRQIVQFIESHPGESGIIYCLRRRDTEKMAQKLRSIGINARAFHAEMPVSEKKTVQRAFINDEVTIVCATIAFGMGIDKSNVRWIIHNNMPKNMESYYQEIGRAGRDGMPAHALMFYSFGDVTTLMNFAQQSGQVGINVEKLQRMQQYAESSICRRRVLLSYFNERMDHDCNNCDVCTHRPERIDGSTIAQMALSAIVRTGQMAGVNTVINILKASRRPDVVEHGYDRLKTYGVGRHLSFAEWHHYMLQLLQLGVFEIAYDENNHLKITDFGEEVLYGRAKIELTKHEARPRPYKTEKTKPRLFAPGELSASDEMLMQRLKETRMALARAKGIAPYLVFSDKVLAVLAHERPVTKAQFSTMYGVGEAKTEMYWRAFTRVIANFGR